MRSFEADVWSRLTVHDARHLVWRPSFFAKVLGEYLCYLT